MRFERHQAVIEVDLPRIYAHIARDNPVAAEQFLDAVSETLGHIAARPEIGVVYPTRNLRMEAVRMLPVSGFQNYLVFYRINTETLRVLYVVHGARHLLRLFRKETRK